MIYILDGLSTASTYRTAVAADRIPHLTPRTHPHDFEVGSRAGCGAAGTAGTAAAETAGGGHVVETPPRKPALCVGAAAAAADLHLGEG